jgi:hypothetical protein
MMSITSRRPLPYDSPATYQIVVQGQIDQTWSDRLEGMHCQVRVEADAPVTTLEGELSDQAALAGVLNTLYGLHLTLLSVNRLKT